MNNYFSSSRASSWPPAWYSHEVCGVGGPVGPVFGPHVQSLFPQLPSERVLEAAEDKHHPLHDSVERDLLHALGFRFLLFGLWFRLGWALTLVVGRFLCWGNWRGVGLSKLSKLPGVESIWVQLWALPFAVAGLAVPAGLGLGLGFTALPSGEPAGLIFLEGGGPEADCRSLLNSNFLFADGCEETIKKINQCLFVCRMLIVANFHTSQTQHALQTI